MKLYIPFNMIVDIDFGLVRIIEKINEFSEYPVNKLKSFLIKRSNENPIPEYCELRNKDGIYDDSYDLIMKNFYGSVLKLSNLTDILAFVINTYKLGLNNEVEITVGCNNDEELNFFNKISKSLKYTINTELNSKIKLNDFDYIFIKCLDEYYVDYLIKNEVNGKRLYVANYEFNTLVDKESGEAIIDPLLHVRLDSVGNIVSLISIYNKK